MRKIEAQMLIAVASRKDWSCDNTRVAVTYFAHGDKIIDRATGEIFVGRVPSYSVIVPGALPGKPLPDGTPGPSLSCAVIVKRVDAQTRAKTAINELLRD